MYWEFIGPLAHLVEHLICNEGVAGSSPVRSTNKKAERLFLFLDLKQAMGIARVRTRKAERAPSQQTGSRAADTTKIFGGKFLVAEESFVSGLEDL